VAASVQNEDPVSVADPYRRNDVGTRAALVTVNAIKRAVQRGLFPFGPPTTSRPGTRSHGSISRLDGAGREHSGLPTRRAAREERHSHEPFG
jgi:hypothetical protein